MALTINHNDWSQYDASGYLDRRGVEVRDLGDGTVRIGHAVYPARELAIADGRIEHIGGAWYLTRA